MYHNLCFEQEKEKYQNFLLNFFFFFYNSKNLYIIHGHVFIMYDPTELITEIKTKEGRK